MIAAPTIDADLAILGGGCAGLSLATRLALSNSKLRVVVIEERARYEEDRTWCGWRTESHPYIDCAAALWPQWRIVSGQQNIERGSQRYLYEMIPADRFYKRSCNLIEQAPNISLMMQTSVISIDEQAESVKITTRDGKTVSSRWVIDTRPKVAPLTPPALWQNFVGYVVHDSQNLLEMLGDVPVLMSFQPKDTSAVQFVYLLPLNSGAYLCEWTRFSKERGQEQEIEQQVKQWIFANAGPHSTLGRRESGSLPMSAMERKMPPSQRIVSAGTAGGSMRASTGYAFHAIQRWADLCLRALLQGKPPVPPARHRPLEFMDDVFLRALQQRGSQGDQIFCNLFRYTPPDALIRFLTGQPRLADYWPVMRGLPWLQFSTAALQSLSGAGVS